jgi:tetrahydromethanopterin S-methyltransferase subunit G
MLEDGQVPKHNLTDCISVNIQGFIDGKVQDLKDIIDARFRAIEDKIKFQADSSQMALVKALDSTQLAITEVKTNTNNRFDNTNEWRAAMKDREANYALRSDLKLVDEITKLHVTRSEMENSIGQIANRLELIESSHISRMDAETKIGETDKKIETSSKDLDKRITAIEGRNMSILVSVIITLLVALLSLAGFKI